jgi:NNP family nitrate/nitrite transporter-like MFS transporter
MPYLLEGFRLSHGQGGLLVTALWIPHAITQAITGWAAEAVGVQRLLRWVLAGLALFVAASLLAPDYTTLLVLRAFTGMGTGASFVLAILYAAAHSDPRFHRRDQALVGTMSYLLTSVAFAIIPLALGFAGWRGGYLPALACILGALTLASLGPRSPQRPRGASVRLPMRAAVRVVWRGRIPVLALAHLCSFGVFVVVASWLTAYLVRATGLSPKGSLYVSAIVLAAGAMGRFAGGAALGRVPDRLLVMGALAGSATALSGLALSPAFPVAPVLAFCVLGCCSLTYGSIFAMALGRRPPGEAGVAVSAVSFMAGLAGSALPTLMGWLVDRTGTFAAGFALLAALSFLAILCLALVPPTPHAATWRPGDGR